MDRVLEKYDMAKNKLPGFGSSWFGHSFGLEIHERPDMIPESPDGDIILEPGMIVTLEPCLLDDLVIESIIKGYRPGGEGLFFAENNYLIIEKGPENLTPLPRDLNIV